MRIKIIATGGTIDKIYYDAKDDFTVGDPQIIEVLKAANVRFAYEVVPLLKKDSLELTNADRDLIHQIITNDSNRHFVITHGTDTMIETARRLLDIEGKTIVLTGAMQPARFKASDAEFNIACAVTAVQLLPPGVYLAMNGCIFDPQKTRKNVSDKRFEKTN